MEPMSLTIILLPGEANHPSWKDTTNLKDGPALSPVWIDIERKYYGDKLCTDINHTRFACKAECTPQVAASIFTPVTQSVDSASRFFHMEFGVCDVLHLIRSFLNVSVAAPAWPLHPILILCEFRAIKDYNGYKAFFYFYYLSGSNYKDWDLIFTIQRLRQKTVLKLINFLTLWGSKND